MPMRPVHGLETIDVEQHDAQQRRIAPRPRHGAGKAIEKLATTRQVGQEIDLGEFSEQLLQFLLPRGTTSLGGDARACLPRMGLGDACIPFLGWYHAALHDDV